MYFVCTYDLRVGAVCYAGGSCIGEQGLESLNVWGFINTAAITSYTYSKYRDVYTTDVHELLHRCHASVSYSEHMMCFCCTQQVWRMRHSRVVANHEPWFTWFTSCMPTWYADDEPWLTTVCLLLRTTSRELCACSARSMSFRAAQAYGMAVSFNAHSWFGLGKGYGLAEGMV